MDKILKDFLKLKEEGVIREDFSSIDELEYVLSQMFSDEYDRASDAQEAFDDLNNELDGLLYEHGAVYHLGDKEWEIVCSSEVSEEVIEKIINQWNNYYGKDISDINDLCSAIEYRVTKDMGNCGCDAYNALSMICDDVFAFDSENNPFYVDCGESNLRISFLYDEDKDSLLLNLLKGNQ